MEIRSIPQPPSVIPSVRSKPLDNPPHLKLSYSDDAGNACLLDELLRQVPANLDVWPGTSLPLLDSLSRHDAATGRALARQLVFVAAVLHRDADERRTAEYLLRHRLDVVANRRTALGLLSAARCAAEMDVRRMRARETAIGPGALISWEAEPVAVQYDEPSVGETVICFLRRATGFAPPTTLARHRLLDAVVIALDLADRHARNNGKAPSVIAMRPAARKDARLVTHLRGAFGDAFAARSVARLLVGGDGSSIETSLLWWAAHSQRRPVHVPARTRDRWVRDLLAADPACRGASARARSHRTPSRHRAA